jgi:hypothetical protein
MLGVFRVRHQRAGTLLGIYSSLASRLCVLAEFAVDPACAAAGDR